MLKLPTFLRNIFGTHGEPQAKPLEAPVFVTGCMRSGTTFLVDKMASHPQLLKIGVELNKVWNDIGGAPIGEVCAHRTAADASPEYTYQLARYFADFIKDSQALKRKAMRRYAKYYHGLGRASYDWAHIVPVNKSPHLMNKLGYVGALFPNSTLILIVRDIYSHSASMKIHFDKWYAKDGRTYFMEEDHKLCYSQTYDAPPAGNRAYPGDFSIIPELWMRMNAVAFEEFESAGFRHKIVVKYEDLVMHQKETLGALFQALGLRDEHSAEARAIAAQATSLVNTTTKGNPLDKWKKQLAPEEIAAIDATIEAQRERYAFIQRELEDKKLNIKA